MPTIPVWLPLAGTLVAPGVGHPDDPVVMPNLAGAFKQDGGTLMGIITQRALEFDWEAGRALVEVEAPQDFLDWLKTTLKSTPVKSLRARFGMKAYNK